MTPLSVAQEALWDESVFAPTRIRYNETLSLRKDGPLDVRALRRALEEIVRRHEAWRTTFDRVRGEPTQVVHAAPAFELPVLDLGHLSPDEAERQAVRVVAEVAKVPFDLRRGPLLRPRLIRFPGEHHRLYLALHHVTFDGISLRRIVLPELIALYGAFCAGGRSPLPEPQAQYADYARWEQDWIAGPRAAQRLEYWRRRLTALPVLPLPLDRPRPQEPRFRGGALSISLSKTTVDRLREIGHGVGATLFQVLAGTWALLLGRYSGDDDVIFATPADLRQRASFESVVGYCLTPVALRIDLSGDPAFTDVASRVRNEVLDALDHLVPFERVVRALGTTAASNANPIYTTMVVMEPSAPPDPSWSMHLVDNELGDAIGNTKLDLELQIDEGPAGDVAARLIYDRDLFDRATATRIAEHWARLAGAVAADPTLPISRIPLLDAAEERQFVEWNATTTVRRPEPVDDLASAWLALQPDAPTPVIQTALVNVATALAADLDIGPADTVLVLPETLFGAAGIGLWVPLVAGAKVVFAAAADAARSGEQLSRLIADENVSFLHATPSTWRTLIDTGLAPARSLRALSSGEPLSQELAERILERCRLLWNGYGKAEAGGISTLGRVERSVPVTIGRPIANSRAYVVDRHGRPVPVGVAGELMLAGDGVAPGYVDGTTAAFVEDPYGPGRAYRTGDLARWLPDGRLALV